MTAMMKLLHLIFQHYGKQIEIKTDTITLISKNATLLIVVYSCKI